jgi:hypothetical protein
MLETAANREDLFKRSFALHGVLQQRLVWIVSLCIEKQRRLAEMLRI